MGDHKSNALALWERKRVRKPDPAASAERPRRAGQAEERRALHRMAERNEAAKLAAAARDHIGELKLTPEPEPPPVFAWGILPDVFHRAWHPLWRLSPLAQRLVVGVILRAAPSERTGVSSVRLANREVVRITCAATSRQRPHRRGESIEAAIEAGIAKRLFSGLAGARRDWSLRYEGAVHFDVRWPAGARWDVGPPVELRLLDQLGPQVQWRLMLAVLRLWWRPGATFTPRRGGGAWKDCPPESWPTADGAVARAWPRDLATSAGALYTQRSRGRAALASLVDRGMVRLDADRIMPSAEFRIVRYGRPIR